MAGDDTIAQQELHELAAPYALDALDESERRAFEEHLSRCARCTDEVDALREAAAELAYAVEAPAPPDALRERVLGAVRADRARVVPLRRRVMLPAAIGAAAAAACAAIALGLWAASLRSSLESERAARGAEARAFEVLAATGARGIPLSGGNGTLVVAPNRRAALVLSSLAPAPPGKTYEAWVVVGGDPKPAGLLEGSRRAAVIALERPVPEGAIVGVSVEPKKGVDEPTGPMLFKARA